MGIRQRFLAAFAAFLVCATPLAGDEPLSVIDWLSDSVEDDAVEADSVEVLAAPADPITVLPLDAPVADRAGLILPASIGLNADALGQSPAGDLLRELSLIDIGSDAPPSIQAFLVAFLQARLDPPIDAAIDDRFFYARIDRLLDMGHLDAAGKLLEAAGLTAPERFRRAFDIALLTGTETQACGTIEATPELSPTYPARIFCLARLGQFDVAAMTLGNAETLGIMSADETQLMLHFLDPELFEEQDLPAPPLRPTPLEFRLYEAVGERVPTDQLPVAFAFADLSSTVGWKSRIRAIERLASTNAKSFADLYDVFHEREPAASGSVWERVTAIQAFGAALNQKDARAMSAALPWAWRAAGEAGYQAAFAQWLIPHLDMLDASDPAAHAGFEIALLAKDYSSARRLSDGSQADLFALSILDGRPGSVPPQDALGRAIVRGLSAVNAGQAYEALLSQDRRGELILRALGALAEDASGNPNSTAQALAALSRVGLSDLAQQISVELVLKEGKP